MPVVEQRAPKPLVLVHGFTGAPASWDAVCAHLASLDAGPAPVRPSLPGHHPEHPVRAGFAANIDALAADIAALVGDRAPYHLVGYSLGARAALFLATHPEHGAKVARLTLIGVHPGLSTREERQARARADNRFVEILRTRGIHAFVDTWQDHPVFASQARLSQAQLDAQRAIRTSHDPHALAASLEEMGLAAMPDLRGPFARLRVPHVPRVPVPIDLVTGALDTRFTHLARALASENPRARHTIIHGCGHNPVLEDPASVARLLARADE